MEDIRWRQRFDNYERSLGHLRIAAEIPEPDIVQEAGIIQFFEITFELAWKTLKDYLEAEGFNDVKTPRTAIKKAFQTGLIDNGELWLEALSNRNLTTHTYVDATAHALAEEIRLHYLPMFERLYQTLKVNHA
jgi:nucleotidyltransferase substrate binding protein (TIGR01987 family)